MRDEIQVGTPVQVAQGLFAGKTGVVEMVDYDSNEAVIRIDPKQGGSFTRLPVTMRISWLEVVR